ncbi:MAG: M1 family metallopeptidase [Archangium sp.]
MRTLFLTTVSMMSWFGCATSAPVPSKIAAAAPAVAALDTTAPRFRLPSSARPTRASLELTIDPEQTSLHGRATYDVEVLRAVDVLWLHGVELTVEAATLGGKPATVLTVPEGGFLGFHLASPLPPGHVELAITFTAKIDREKSRGVYSEAERGVRYAYTFFEAIDARRAFPNFDEPGFKIPWALTLHVRKEHVARANAPIVSERDEPGGFKQVVFAESKPLPSYLVAFMVGPFDVIDGGVAGRAQTPIHFVVPKGREGELGYAKTITPKVVTALEDYFDMPYPFVKLDVAVVPRFWGTMEHPGLLAMGQPLTLIRPEQETRERQERYANIAAHELAHYWFGDLLTMAWWNDTWLNESMGQWLDLIITDAVAPAWHLREDVDRPLDALARDEALTAKRIRQPVETPQDIEASFDGALTYNKGNSVLTMFEHALGRDAWRDFMRTWVRKHEWKNVSADDFLDDLSAAFGPARAAQFRTFLEQPGAPLLRSKVACTGGKATLTLTQERSLPAGTKDDVAHEWKMPVCFRFGDAKQSSRQCVDLEAHSTTVTLDRCPTWVVLNEDGAGYFRSEVDATALKALFTPRSPLASAARLAVTEKLMLLGDVSAAVDRKEVPIETQLALAPLVFSDADARVAAGGVSLARVPSDPLDDATWKKLRAWQRKVFGARARQLGWKRQPGDSDDVHRLRRMLLWLVAEDDAALRDEGAKLGRAWLATRTGIADDLVPVALRLLARTGSAADFDALVQRALDTGDRDEQARLLSAVGSFTDPKLLERALALLNDPRFDVRDSARVLGAALNTRDNRAATYTWLEKHLDEVLSRMRDDEASWVLSDVASACSAELLPRAKALSEPRAPKYGGAENYVRSSLEQSAMCVALSKEQLPAIVKFLTAGP